MAKEPEWDETAIKSARSLVLTFTHPARRLLLTQPLHNHFRSVVGQISIDGLTVFCDESPMIVQPDLLVDRASQRAIGLVFDLTHPDWMLTRCLKMLRTLDSDAIRIAGCTLEPTKDSKHDICLEILWGKASDYDRVFAQFDFGIWKYMYTTPRPNLLEDGTAWSVPAGIVIGELADLGYPLSVKSGESGEAIVEKTDD